MTEAELTALERLADAATPAPWEYAEAKKGWGYPSLDIRQGYDGEMEERDAQFIAAARTAVPALVAEVRAKDAEIVRLRALAKVALIEGLAIEGYDEVYAEHHWEDSDVRKALDGGA